MKVVETAFYQYLCSLLHRRIPSFKEYFRPLNIILVWTEVFNLLRWKACYGKTFGNLNRNRCTTCKRSKYIRALTIKVFLYSAEDLRPYFLFSFRSGFHKGRQRSTRSSKISVT